MAYLSSARVGLPKTRPPVADLIRFTHRTQISKLLEVTIVEKSSVIRFVLKCIMGIVAAGFVFLCIRRFVLERGHVGPPTAGHATTWVSGPLHTDGYVDYFAASNEIRAKDISPSDNAAIDLLRAIGPRDWNANCLVQQWSVLTTAVPAEDFDQYKLPRNRIYQEAPEEIWDQLQEAEHRPWTTDEFPGVNRWIDSNAAALRLIERASGKPSFWLPMVPDPEYGPTLYNGATGVAYIPSLAFCLQTRAMRSLGQGRVEEGLDDLIAVRRIAALITKRADTTQHGQATRIVFRLFEAESQMIQSSLNMEQLERYGNLLNSLDDFSLPPETISTHNRLEMLSALQSTHAESKGAFDIDVSMRIVNEYHDHLHAILSETDDGTSAAWLHELYDRLDTIDGDNSTSQIIFGGRRTRAHGIGTKIINLLAPALNSERRILTGCRVRTDLIRTGIAIQMFRLAHQRLPEQLSELVPEYLNEILLDGFTDGMRFRYLPTENSCRLMSVGNGQWPESEQGIVLEM